MQFNQKQYDKEHFDFIGFRLPKGSKADLQQLASDNGLSLTQFIIQTLEDVHGIDLHSRRPSSVQE